MRLLVSASLRKSADESSCSHSCYEAQLEEGERGAGRLEGDAERHTVDFLHNIFTPAV